MSLIDQQLENAKKLGLNNIVSMGPSSRKDKRFRVTFTHGGKLLKVNYGAPGMQTFLEHKDEKRRKNFHQRFASNKGYNDPKSGLFWSARLLWS